MSRHKSSTSTELRRSIVLYHTTAKTKKSPAPTLTQIEDSVLHFRQQIGREMAEAAIQAQDMVTVAPGPRVRLAGKRWNPNQRKGNRSLREWVI
jgi:hypothetical protein